MSRNEKLYQVIIMLYEQLVAALAPTELKTPDHPNKPTHENIVDAYIPHINKLKEKINDKLNYNSDLINTDYYKEWIDRSKSGDMVVFCLWDDINLVGIKMEHGVRIKNNDSIKEELKELRSEIFLMILHSFKNNKHE